MENHRQNIYEAVNETILRHLESGVVPWRQTWIGKGRPVNRLTGRPYRGINHILLNTLRYPTGEFVSFKQAKELGGSVRRGERGHMVVFWKWIEPERDGQAEIEQDLSRYPYIQYHTVWNVAQCEGIEPLALPSLQGEVPPSDRAERVVEGMADLPMIQFLDPEAYYDPRTDVVNVPERRHFESTGAYYSVLFHELVHSTGHKTRLSRKGITETIRFGSSEYSFEELVAEMGACYLLSHCGMAPDNFSNNAAYIAGWMRKLKQERYAFIHASVSAQRALDYILGVGDKAE
ncbi:MAG: DUF1738 domain-containing protein [Bacteroidetes bacterium]|nr:DUF1738 domain-containing protein [Bacteroidota bacterium]